MSADEEVSYKRSVRNVSVLLFVVVIVVISSLVLTTYFTPTNAPVTSTLVYSPIGITLSMKLNATSAFNPSGVNITLWINGTSSIESIKAQNSWLLSPSMLWTPACKPGWPIGIGITRGYYDIYNYTSGALLLLGKTVIPQCPEAGLPQSFIIEPHGSEAIVNFSDTLDRWDLQMTLVLGSNTFVQRQEVGGPFTVIGADEWGDVVILHIDAPLNMT